MDRIIIVANDGEEEPVDDAYRSGRFDFTDVDAAINAELNASRPQRYHKKEYGWQATAEAIAIEMLSDPAITQDLIIDTAKRRVAKTEGNAKSRARDLFPIAVEQLTFGHDDPEVIKQFLRDKWHLPLQINDGGEMVIIGAMLPSDWSELDTYEKQKMKEAAAAHQIVLDGINIFKTITERHNATLEDLFGED
jgi:hypothetical protein